MEIVSFLELIIKNNCLVFDNPVIGKRLKFGQTMDKAELQMLFHSGNSPQIERAQINLTKNKNSQFESKKPTARFNEADPHNYPTFSRDGDREGKLTRT